MRCEEAINQLNDRTDGELTAEETAGLNMHLAECAACRAASGGVQSIDAVATTPVVVPTHKLSWGQALMAMAAGFLLAVILFRPWEMNLQEAAVLPTPEPIARLAVATGPVDMKPWQQVEFFTCPTSAPIGKDSIVRTGPSARCEIALDDGNAVRLDNDTEVTLHGADVVEVNRGRLWSASATGRGVVSVQTSG